jgi:hypothetical protein
MDALQNNFCKFDELATTMVTLKSCKETQNTILVLRV